MGRRSVSGGVVPLGTSRIQFDFNIDRTRFRPTLLWVPTEANLWRARTRLAHQGADCRWHVFIRRAVSRVSC
jgi:Arm DNA-binding domain